MLIDPATPLRTTYFKVKGHEQDPVANFVDVTIVADISGAYDATTDTFSVQSDLSV